MQRPSQPPLPVCKMGSDCHAGRSLGFRVPKDTIAQYVVFCAFLSVYTCIRKGTISKGYKKQMASSENRRQRGFSCLPLVVLGQPQGSPPRPGWGSGGAGHLYGPWWSKDISWTSLLSSPHTYISHQACACHPLL